MVIEISKRATERQRKYLGWLSSRGKEIFGKEFSIRKLAEERGINWLEMTQDEASKLIDEVREMIEKTEFFVSDEELVTEVAQAGVEQEQKEEKQEEEKEQATFVVMAKVPAEKIQAMKEILKAMGIQYQILTEVEG